MIIQYFQILSHIFYIFTYFPICSINSKTYMLRFWGVWQRWQGVLPVAKSIQDIILSTQEPAKITSRPLLLLAKKHFSRLSRIYCDTTGGRADAGHDMQRRAIPRHVVPASDRDRAHSGCTYVRYKDIVCMGPRLLSPFPPFCSHFPVFFSPAPCPSSHSAPSSSSPHSLSCIFPTRPSHTDQ